ncbi:multidrug and toxin extrusion protein 2 isoform X4 [Ornithorhynchus anatinus]|uniref:multidrug and toxin extrusion protein 2 isoform X4 n=1 Tax=Ornithorhynchus anatinus TaxID=9258 RepID=UPI0010A84E9B|nr:multidrug and toxin extrusion protein 2 isoform X4 [Ornithorhynchus anatinus]
MELGQETTRETVPRANKGELSPTPGDCGGHRGRRSWVQWLIPVGFRKEAWELCVLAGPLFLVQVLLFLIHVVSTVFCGHLGKVELAAVTLAVAFINVCGISVGFGLSSACDTLLSQTYGSSNKKMVGVVLQRGILILLLCCFPCWALFINTESILLLLRQDPQVSSLTQKYVMIFVPALPAVFLYGLLTRYLQNQEIIWPAVFSGIFGNVINGLGNYIFLYILDWGLEGSAFANTISQFAQVICLFLYIVLRKLYLETWGGWNSDSLQEWGPFFSLAVPSMLMMCIEWWAYEIGSFLIGLLSVVDLSAQSIIYEVSTLMYMLPMGLSLAACVRVGMALGAGDPEQAKKSSSTALHCTGLLFLVMGSLLTAFKDSLAYIFTDDEEVSALVGKVMPIYIVFNLFESLCVSISPKETHCPRATSSWSLSLPLSHLHFFSPLPTTPAPPVHLWWSAKRDREAGLRGHRERGRLLCHRPPLGNRADLCCQNQSRRPLGGDAHLCHPGHRHLHCLHLQG